MATEVWSDLDHRLITDGRGNIKKVINADAVATSIDNILRTRKGERVMLRDFGSNLHDLLFENMSDAYMASIADDIKKAINRWDNRVIINSIDINMYPDKNAIDVITSFAIKGYDKIFEHTTTVEF